MRNERRENDHRNQFDKKAGNSSPEGSEARRRRSRGSNSDGVGVDMSSALSPSMIIGFGNGVNECWPVVIARIWLRVGLCD